MRASSLTGQGIAALLCLCALWQNEARAQPPASEGDATPAREAPFTSQPAGAAPAGEHVGQPAAGSAAQPADAPARTPASPYPPQQYPPQQYPPQQYPPQQYPPQQYPPQQYPPQQYPLQQQYPQHQQYPPQQYPPQQYPPQPYGPGPDKASKARVAHAHSDRVVLLPTAYTHPEGTFYASSYEILLLQVGYAFSDSSQVSITATPPIGEDGIFPLDVTLKHAIVQKGPVRVAALGALTGLIGLEEGNFLLGRVGGVTQLCFDTPCRSSASVMSTVLLAGPATLMLTGAGFEWRVARSVALLLEIDMLVPLGREAGEANGAAVLPGIRFPFDNWAIDIALGRTVDRTTNAPVIPVLAATYRFLP